jgi:hypothetical protein
VIPTDAGEKQNPEPVPQLDELIIDACVETGVAAWDGMGAYLGCYDRRNDQREPSYRFHRVTLLSPSCRSVASHIYVATLHATTRTRPISSQYSPARALRPLRVGKVAEPY